jgi:hypothetical protein
MCTEPDVFINESSRGKRVAYEEDHDVDDVMKLDDAGLRSSNSK